MSPPTRSEGPPIRPPDSTPDGAQDPNAVGEPDSSPEPAPDAEPQCPEGTRSADGECHPSQPDPDPEPAAEPDSEPASDPEPAPDPDPDPDPGPVRELLGCPDECELGEMDGGGRRCALQDVSTGEWVDSDPNGSLRDRAREYRSLLLNAGTAHGGIGDAIYSDPPAYEHRIALGGTGDSAIWTGTWLAAEALRLRATGSPAAERRIAEIVRTLHLWFNVSGDPGLLARFAAPAGEHPLVGMDCARRRIHCDTVFEGRAYDWSGHISRDQYAGVMLGYSLAYETTSDRAVQSMIREDVVELVRELLRERTIPVVIHWNGTPIGPIDLVTRYAVISTHELIDGAAEITVDTNDFGASEIWAIREFVPDVGPLLRQIPILGALVPERAPRADSAVMMLSFLRMGIQMTDGVDGFEDDYRAFSDHYGAHFEEWLALAAEWSYGGQCGGSYYANNIVMEPMYVLGRLQAGADHRRAGRIAREILDARMWPEHRASKNPWFAFMHAAQSSEDRASEVATVIDQLGQFPPPPRIDVAVDLRGDPRYFDRAPDCGDQVAHDQAIDVADRPPSDFLWQRNPWNFVGGGNPARTYPGVDFLAAYWLGRAEGFIETPDRERCLRWRYEPVSSVAPPQVQRTEPCALPDLGGCCAPSG